MERLTVEVEVRTINSQSKVTYKNTLFLGDMKLSDTLKTEIAVADAIRAIGIEELKKAEAEESKA